MFVYYNTRCKPKDPELDRIGSRATMNLDGGRVWKKEIKKEREEKKEVWEGRGEERKKESGKEEGFKWQ